MPKAQINKTVFWCEFRLTVGKLRNKPKSSRVDEYRNALLDCSGKTEPLPEETLEAIIGGFEYHLQSRSIVWSTNRHLKFELIDFQLKGDFSSVEVMRGMGKAIFGSFLTAEPVLLEPIYKIIITVAADLASEISRILCTQTRQSHFV